jgi:NitT/TauT family transport system substrate-binding protein/putative hydroxymethylpyrimidine transport system substrate-binding protein
MGQPASPGGRRTGALLAALVVAVLLIAPAGCGNGKASRGASQLRGATLLLDFTPNAVHAGIYRAKAQGYDRDAGIRLTVRVPGSSTDSVKLLAAGRADLAVMDVHDLGLAREKGRDIVGVMALVQRPLAAVLAQPGVVRPRALAGRRAGVTGLPSDVAVLDSVIRGDGGDPKAVRTITIGFEAVQALLANRVDAATAFWNAEGVALRRRGLKVREFRVDDYGAPRYPELVVCVTRETLRRQRGLVQDVVAAIVRGQRDVIAHPAEGVAALTGAQPGLDQGLTTAELRVLRPALADAAGRVGTLDLATLRAWGAWDARFGILHAAPDVGAAFDPTVAAGGSATKPAHGSRGAY